MRVVISGGSGLIGSAVTEALVKKGDEVVILTRSPQRQTAEGGVRYVKWDGRTRGDWAKEIDGAGAVINLAGENLAGGRWTPERKLRIIKSRVDSGHVLSEAIAQAEQKPSVLLQASAVGYYPTSERAVFTENDPSADSFENKVVQVWEASTAEVEAMGVARYVMRIAVALSTEGGALPRMTLPFKLFAGGPLGSGRQAVAWIHLDDLVEAMLFLIYERPEAGVYNLAAPENVTNAQFGRAIAKALGRPYFLPAPALAIRLLFGEMATVVLDGRRVSSEKLQSTGFHFKYPTVEGAIQQLLKKDKA